MAGVRMNFGRHVEPETIESRQRYADYILSDDCLLPIGIEAMRDFRDAWMVAHGWSVVVPRQEVSRGIRHLRMREALFLAHPAIPHDQAMKLCLLYGGW